MTAPDAEELDQFVIENRQWLTEEAEEVLRAMTGEDQRHVMNEGSMSNCRDPVGVVKSRAHQGPMKAHKKWLEERRLYSTADKLEDYIEFNRPWLNAEAEDVLRDVPEDVCDAVMEVGSLAGCRDPVAVVKSRAKQARAKGLGRGNRGKGKGKGKPRIWDEGRRDSRDWSGGFGGGGGCRGPKGGPKGGSGASWGKGGGGAYVSGGGYGRNEKGLSKGFLGDGKDRRGAEDVKEESPAREAKPEIGSGVGKIPPGKTHPQGPWVDQWTVWQEGAATEENSRKKEEVTQANKRAVDEGRALHVAGVPPMWTPKQIEQFFNHQGSVDWVHILPVQGTSGHRAAIINFSTTADATRAQEVCDKLEIEDGGKQFLITCSVKRYHKKREAVYAKARLEGRTVFLSRLSMDMLEAQLRPIGETFGNVEDARMLPNLNGRFQAAFVTMTTPEEAQNMILGLHDTEVLGSRITAAIAKPKEDHLKKRKRDDTSEFFVNVANFPEWTEEDDLKAIVESADLHVVGVHIISHNSDPQNSLARVYFSDAYSPNLALALDGCEFTPGFSLQIRAAPALPAVVAPPVVVAPSAAPMPSAAVPTSSGAQDDVSDWWPPDPFGW